VSDAGGGRAVLITGCSSGIGRAAALHLDAAGWRVYAGVRKEADAESLAGEASAALTPLILDVADGTSIELAAERIEGEAKGGLAGLVNNAGIAVSGPLEFIPIEDFRRQIEVNLTGHVAMIQANLPALRRASGRIVNVTSIGGLVTTPFFAPYCASKFGLEAISDSLRVELRPWGIETIAVEPGSIDTGIWSGGAKIFEEMRQRMPAKAMKLYGEAMQATAKASEETGERGIPPERVATVIETALTTSRPRSRYRVGRDAHLMALSSRLLPDRVYDRIVGRALKLP
jgi:NAD(P)-dependent dehydrogenase (short-subunit alcohol dehydrogenase family)